MEMHGLCHKIVNNLRSRGCDEQMQYTQYSRLVIRAKRGQDGSVGSTDALQGGCNCRGDEKSKHGSSSLVV